MRADIITAAGGKGNRQGKKHGEAVRGQRRVSFAEGLCQKEYGHGHCACRGGGHDVLRAAG